MSGEERILANGVEAFVEAMSGRGPQKVRGPKLIHDPIHGTQLLEAWEIAVLDLPLLQRLRLISQTDVASLVFPGATHSRFDHSIGTRILAGRMLETLGSRWPEINRYRTEVLLAALLHDVGHLPFSHSGEASVEALTGYPARLAGTGLDHLAGCRLHEILSYLVVTGEAFDRLVGRPFREIYGLDPNWQLVGQMIIGQVRAPRLHYLSDLINGPLDADKLDYISRDSHYAGLHLKTNLSRHLNALAMVPSGDRTALGVDLKGVHTLEQILFQRAVLWGTVYHHHKVRAASWVVRGLFQALWENSDPTDFLALTDIEVLADTDPRGREWRRRLRERDLFKRALVLSDLTLLEGAENLRTDLDSGDGRQTAARSFEERVAQQAGLDPSEVWLDLPETPWPEGASSVPVLMPGDEEVSTIGQVSGEAGPGQVYLERRWRGHVFTVDNGPARRRVAKAASEALEEELGVKVGPLATALARID